MKNIDLLEYGGADVAGPFCIEHDGVITPLDDPRERNFQWVLTALQLKHVPSIPENIPSWQHDAIFVRWCAAWDLPRFEDARRLAYLVDNYRAAISHDLSVYTNYDLGNLWRARRWTLLLDIIDRLPAHSWYAASVAQDEEHAQMIAESLAARRSSGAEEDEPKGPPLTSWTPEVAALTSILDAVRQVSYTIVASQVGSNKAGEPPKPAPRPTTPLEAALAAATKRTRMEKHNWIVGRVLGRPRPDVEPELPPEPVDRKPSPADVARVLAKKGAVKS